MSTGRRCYLLLKQAFANPHDVVVSRDGESMYVVEIGPNRIVKFALEWSSWFNHTFLIIIIIIIILSKNCFTLRNDIYIKALSIIVILNSLTKKNYLNQFKQCRPQYYIYKTQYRLKKHNGC